MGLAWVYIYPGLIFNRHQRHFYERYAIRIFQNGRLIMLDKLFKFIAEKWQQMPREVQVFTYLLFVFLFSYLLLVPQYVDGKLMGIDEQNREFAIQHETFELDVDGRTIRFVTNSRGRFAIPKPGKLPGNQIALTFFPDGTGRGAHEVDVIIPFVDTLLGRTKVLVKKGEYYTANYQPSNLPSLFPKAYAQDAMQADNNTHISAIDTIKKAFPVPITAENKSLAELDLSAMQLSEVYAQIEREHDIVINTDRNQIKSISDLANLIEQQKAPQSWESIMSSAWVKPKGVFGQQYVLPITGTDYQIKPMKLLDDSVRFQVASADGNPLFTGNLYQGERVNFELEGQTYSVELEKVDNAGLDFLFNPKAAYFNVNKN